MLVGNPGTSWPSYEKPGRQGPQLSPGPRVRVSKVRCTVCTPSISSVLLLPHWPRISRFQISKLQYPTLRPQLPTCPACFNFLLWNNFKYTEKLLVQSSWIPLPRLSRFFFLRFYSFIREREREAETQAEGEAGSMQGDWCGTWSRDHTLSWRQAPNRRATQGSPIFQIL